VAEREVVKRQDEEKWNEKKRMRHREKRHGKMPHTPSALFLVVAREERLTHA